MLLFAETTISTISSYVASLPEPVELLVFGIVITAAALMLRSLSPKAPQPEAEEENRNEGLI
jgi:hypothetical protein